jgi:hypothetical protein
MTTSSSTTSQNYDVSSTQALWGSIAFSFLFTALIYAVRPWLPQIEFLPDAGASWYYWQLPEPTWLSRASAWGGYFLHQVFAWWTIYYAQKNKLKYTNTLQWINKVSLVGTAGFMVLHLLQTAVWYDGLAQDTSIWSSQGSVILLLVMVLLMENQRRGLFFGKKVSWLKETGRVVRDYHGYVFAWATIYTFWYHPMEASFGHLIGFLYTFFLMMQGALMFTRAHVNRYWTVALELMVLIHGTLVAVQTNTMWPMFFFGFAGLFVVTQMHGLGLKLWVRWGFLLAYVAGVLVVYSQRGWDKLDEIIRIPLIEYLLVFVLALIIWLGMKVVGFFAGFTSRSNELASGD